MKVVWMLLSLIIALVVIYLIWEEFIADKDDAPENEWEREFEADLKALGEEAKYTPATGTQTAVDAVESAGESTGAAADAVAPVTDAPVTETVEETTTEETTTEAAAAVEETVDAAVDTVEDTTRAGGDAIDALAEAVAAPDPDDLTKIKGIGKVYEGRLNEAGIYTYEQIIEASPAALKEIANAIEAANVEDWERQARELIAARNG